MVYILLADGFEEAEAIVPCDILRRGGVEVRLVGLESRKVTSAHGVRMEADMTLADADLGEMELVMLPGGLAGVENTRQNTAAVQLLQDSLGQGKYVAAICAAPTILGSLGLLDGQKAVCYPGMEEGLGKAQVCKGEQVVCSGNIITGEGPGSSYEFGYQLLETLRGKAVMEEVKHGMHFHH